MIDEHGETVTLTECDESGELTPGEHERSDVRVVREGESSLRVILDPFGEDHDVLVECQKDKWLICVHPAQGDPICHVEIFRHRVVVTDCAGAVLLAEDL